MTDEMQTPETNEVEPSTTHDTNPTPTVEDDAAEKPTHDAALRREAAKYRRRLRETEAERDALATQLAGIRKNEVQRALGEHLADPSDLGELDLDSFYKDGSLDPDAVRKAAAAAVAEHPHWRRQPPTTMDGGVRESIPASGPSFGEALKRAAS